MSRRIPLSLILSPLSPILSLILSLAMLALLATPGLADDITSMHRRIQNSRSEENEPDYIAWNAAVPLKVVDEDSPTPSSEAIKRAIRDSNRAKNLAIKEAARISPADRKLFVEKIKGESVHWPQIRLPVKGGDFGVLRRGELKYLPLVPALVEQDVVVCHVGRFDTKEECYVALRGFSTQGISEGRPFALPNPVFVSGAEQIGGHSVFVLRPLVIDDDAKSSTKR